MENQAYTDEINLYDYLKIIYKWKFLIAALCVLSVITTYLIASRPAPTTYKVTALVSSGALSYTPEGKEIPIDSAANIQSLIQNGALNSKIIEKLKLDPAQYSGMQFTTQMPKDSDVIRVFYDTPDPEKGKVIMNELMNQLSDSYKNRLVLNRETVSKQIEKLKNTLTLQKNKKERVQSQRYRLQNQKELLQNKKERKNNEKKRLLSDSELMRNKLALLMDSEKNMQGLSKKAEENLNTLSIERNELLKKGDKTDTSFLVFYSNTIQQAIYRIDKLRSDIENNSMQQASIKTELKKHETILKDLDTEVNDIEAQVKDIETQVKDITTQEKDLDIETQTPLREIESITKLGATGTENIKILQQPNASINTVEMRRGKKAAAAGITTLFIGIILAFFIEYVKKMQRTVK